MSPPAHHQRPTDSHRPAYRPPVPARWWAPVQSAASSARALALERTLTISARTRSELDSHGVLRYYADCNDKPVKRGGSTKTQLCGYEEKGSINLTDAQEVRLSTAPNAKPGEIEIVTAERTFRMIPGRSAPGTRRIPDKVKAGQTWCVCLNMANLAALGEASGMNMAGPELRASIQRASSRDLSAVGSAEEGGDPIDRAVARTQQSARDLASLA